MSDSSEPQEQYGKAGRVLRSRNKTAQDRMPVDQRPRKQMNDRQRAWIQENKPVRSADYARMPR